MGGTPLENRLAALEQENTRLSEEIKKLRLDSDTRAAANHHMIAQLLRLVYALGNHTDEHVKENHDKFRKLFSRVTHEAPTPEMSDHIAGEIQYWIDQILNDAEEIRQEYRSRGLPG